MFIESEFPEFIDQSKLELKDLRFGVLDFYEADGGDADSDADGGGVGGGGNNGGDAGGDTGGSEAEGGEASGGEADSADESSSTTSGVAESQSDAQAAEDAANRGDISGAGGRDAYEFHQEMQAQDYSATGQHDLAADSFGKAGQYNSAALEAAKAGSFIDAIGYAALGLVDDLTAALGSKVGSTFGVALGMAVNPYAAIALGIIGVIAGKKVGTNIGVSMQQAISAPDLSIKSVQDAISELDISDSESTWNEVEKLLNDPDLLMKTAKKFGEDNSKVMQGYSLLRQRTNIFGSAQRGGRILV